MKITPQRLRNLLSYDATTGQFTWLVQRSIRVKIGCAAGNLNRGDGYWYIQVDYRSYPAHRLAWLYVHGEWPKEHIDHIDGDRINNRLNNLRDVSRSVNLQNRKRASVHNKTGYLGVSPFKTKFMANIRLAGKRTYLGLFATPEIAYAAYLEAKRTIHLGNTL